jgi:hypothetical protein
MGVSIEELTLRIEQLEDKIKAMQKTCCSVHGVEERVKTSLLLTQTIEKLDALNFKLDMQDKTLVRHEKYFYVIMSVIVILQFVGFDNIKAFIR